MFQMDTFFGGFHPLQGLVMLISAVFPLYPLGDTLLSDKRGERHKM